MKSGGGKQKGAAHERKVCEALSLWVSEGKDKNIFWRSAMSGGRATVQGKKGVKNASQAGDISAISEAGYPYTDKYYFECKNYKSLNVKSLVYNKPLKNSLLDFWNINVEKAEEVNKELVIIAKENNCLILFCVSSTSNIIKTFKYDYELFPLAIYGRLGIAVFLFDEVLELVDSKSLL